MTTETLFLLILGLSFLLAVIRTAIREALRHAKPTTINHGTIIHHHYEFDKTEIEKIRLPEKIISAAQIFGEIQNEIQMPPK